MKQGNDEGIIGHIGPYRLMILADAAVEALENFAFTAVMIGMRVDAVVDGQAERHVVEAFRRRCLDLRQVAGREAMDLVDRIEQASAAEQPRTA
jgi:hypothetical protein